MRELQKFINNSLCYDRRTGKFTHEFTKSELKSLLEQVAREQREICFEEWGEKSDHHDNLIAEVADAEEAKLAPLVTDNLTFNED